MHRSPRLRLLALTLVVFGVVAASADATTFCVNDPACVTSGGTSQLTIQAAFTAAAAATPPSTVLIGPGQYGGGASYSSTKQITVTGAGEGQTVITLTGHGAGLAVGGNDNDVVSALSIQVNGDNAMFQAAGLTLGHGTADHVAVSLSGLGAAGFTIGPGTVTNSSVTTASNTTASLGIDIEGGPAIVQDTTVSAATGIGGGSPVILQRDTIDATDTGFRCLGVCALSDTVISMAAGSNDGLLAPCVFGGTTVSSDNMTIVGPAAASVAATCGGTGLQTAITLDSSIVRGATHALSVAATAATASATITPTYDDYDPATDAVTGGPGSASIASPGTGQINADPLFVNPSAGDYRVTWNSPTVDSGDPAGLGLLDSTTDLGGNPRIAHGRRDMGAFEYTPLPPTASISQDRQTAATGQTVHFDASKSTDPNPGDSLKFTWTTDDGAGGTGSTFAHAFSKPGTHTVTLTVTDPTGLTATASTTVAITPAPPSITALHQSRKRWRVGQGTTFRFRLSQDASVRLVFRRHGHKVATLTRHCHAGLNRIRFSGRLKHAGQLSAGRYSVTFTATNPTGTSKPRSLKFRVL
jgi:PKD domain-containing protein